MSAHNHVIQRAKDRYGLDLTARDVADMTVAILDGKNAILAAVLPGGEAEEWYVAVHGIRVRVLFQKVHRFIITLLPMEPIRGRRPANTKGHGRRRMKSPRRRGRPAPGFDLDEHEVMAL